MVEAGLGVALQNGLFDGLWSGEVVSRRLSPPVIVPIGVAVPKREVISPAARRFRDFAAAEGWEQLQSVKPGKR